MSSRKTSEPVVTVILPTYNHEESVALALDSILCQETDFNFIILVLEDASTDRTRDLCSKYAAEHPGRIELVARETNLGAEKNLYDGFSRVHTPYLAYLEGDDYWCDNRKLQMQVDALEGNPDCTMCGHDTLVRDLATGEEWSFVRKLMTPRGRTKFSLKTNPFWTHPSSRLYRNVIDMSNVPSAMMYDTSILYVYQTVGDCYYIDRTMSVYNLTGSGAWTGAHRLTRKMNSLRGSYAKNRYCDFRFDRYLGPYSRLRKALTLCFGKRLGWFLFFHTRMTQFRLLISYDLICAKWRKLTVDHQ